MNILAIIKAEDLKTVTDQLQKIDETDRPVFSVKRIKDEQEYYVVGYAGCPEEVQEVMNSISEIECIETDNMAEWLAEHNYRPEREPEEEYEDPREDRSEITSEK